MHKRWWWLVVGALGGGAIAATIAWMLAGDDVNKLGDWRHGPGRFIGAVTAIGIMGGYVIARQLAGKAPATRDGFTVSYLPLDPKAEGYREMTTPRVEDLLAELRAVGYAPTTEQCDATGEPRGVPIDPTSALGGVNFAIRDPGVRGWVRLQLSPPINNQPRSLGLLEIWAQRGDSTEELALFVLRALDKLLDDVKAARESSVLSQDAAAMLTAGLGERPVHRKG